MSGNDKEEEMRKIAWDLLKVKGEAGRHLMGAESNLVGVLIGVTTNGVVAGLVGIFEVSVGVSWSLYLGILLVSMAATVLVARRWIGNYLYFKDIMDYMDEAYPSEVFEPMAYGSDYSKYYEGFKEWRRTKRGR